MLEACKNVTLGFEKADELGSMIAGSQHLQGNGLGVESVRAFRAIYMRHAARTEKRIDAIRTDGAARLEHGVRDAAGTVRGRIQSCLDAERRGLQVRVQH